MLFEILIFLLTFLIIYVLYLHKKIQSRFDKYGVKYLPGVPVLGNLLKSTFQKRHFIFDLDEVYKAFPDERYVGFIEGMSQAILVRDPDLIKQITVKDFDYFMNHKEFFPGNSEPLFGDSLFSMKGNRWRDMRTTLSPAFTGSKMRLMLPFMTEISANIVEYLKENVPANEHVDVQDLVRRYTSDVIASAGFGLQLNSLKDKDNEFYTLGQGIFNFGTKQRINMFFMGQMPRVAKLFKMRIFPESTTQFFRTLVSNTIEYRQKNNVERPDMIQLLMEASKGTLKDTPIEKDSVGFATVNEALKPQGKTTDWTLSELTGQVFIFFLAGFDTSATTMVMCIHELAVNPDVQEKLYQEVRSFKEKHGSLTYDNINELKYMDCVLNETMRKWAAAIFMDRVCNKPYELPPSREGGKPYALKPGDVVYNMVNTLHMDEKYYPDPDKFDPERFSDENKHKILPFTFQPFGMGPRNCIGSRFALMELKVFLYAIMLNFKIVKGSKTSDPIRLVAADFNIRAENGTHVLFVPRN